MAAIALAILGKRNEPLYLREFKSENHEPSMSQEELFGLAGTAEEGSSSRDDKQQSLHEACSVKQQFVLHAALDRLDQVLARGQWRKQGVAGTDAMFVGLLCPVEDLRVYGYMTTTQVRFLLTVQDSAETSQQTTDQAIKSLLANIHRYYVEYTLNLFNELDTTICSPKFDANVQQCVDAFNNE